MQLSASGHYKKHSLALRTKVNAVYYFYYFEHHLRPALSSKRPQVIAQTLRDNARYHLANIVRIS